MLRRSDLVGVWRLVSHETCSAQGNFKDTGSKAWGSLIYLENGFMSVSINWEEAPVPYLFYSGRFEFDEKNQLVFHWVENSSQEWRIGKKLERRVKWEAGHLVLTGEASGGTARVVWRRA